MGPLWDRGDFETAACGNSQLMNQPAAAETASCAFPLPCTLLAKGMQLQFQEAFTFCQLRSKVTNKKGKLLEDVY